MSPSTNTRSRLTEKITLFSEATTIPSPPWPFMDQAGLDITPKSIRASFNRKFYKPHEELLNLTTMLFLPHNFTV